MEGALTPSRRLLSKAFKLKPHSPARGGVEFPNSKTKYRTHAEAEKCGLSINSFAKLILR